MFGSKPRFIRPGEEPLYPTRKDGSIETYINPNTDSALSIDNDSKPRVVYNRHHHLPLDVQRQKLPVFQYRNHILYLLESYQTLVLVGETGCGKSTQVPQYLFECGHAVCVTQPRAVAAAALAARVAAERGAEVGGVVGFVAGQRAERAVDTGIVFMTEGALLREMFASPLLMQYSAIILDEVHERSQMTDILMGLLKKVAKKRKNLKIIVSSATMDADFLKEFFNLKEKTQDKDTSVIMSMEGRTFPIDVYYLEEPAPDYVRSAVDTAIKIHEREPFGDVLAFLTSQEEIIEAERILNEYAVENNATNKHRKHHPSGIRAYDLLVCPLYGSLPLYRQIKAMQLAPANSRKIVLATNVAETSLTVPGICYVIDSGFHKLPYFDPTLGLECLSVCPVSKNNAVQRAGRAGRQSRGKCYRLYTEEAYNTLPDSVPPEICRSDLSSALLQLKALGIHNLLRFTFPIAPPAKSLLAGLESLYALRAIDQQGDLTQDLGVCMAELPLKPSLGKILCSGGEFGCLDEILSIVTMLQMDSVFVKPSTGKEIINAKICRRNNFEVAEGDIMMYLNIYDAYQKVITECGKDEKRRNKAAKDWCNRMYINYRVMEKASEIRSGLKKLVKNKFKIENKTFDGPDLGSAKCVRVMQCVLSGLFETAAYLSPLGHYRTVKGRDTELYISPDSCLSNASQPQWLVFASVQSSHGKTYMRDVMAVKKEWLFEIAPHYFKEI